MAQIVGSGVSLQVGEVLLSELNLAVFLDLAVVALALNTSHVLSGGLVGEGDAVDGDRVAVLVLNHGSLQGVESIQAGLFTGDSLNAVEIALQIVVQADVQSALGNVDGPVVAGVALGGGIIAQSAQQHLHERIAAQGCSGTEGAVSVAADDAFLGAVSNVANEGVGGGNVAVGSSVSHQSGSGGGAKDQVADDLGGSAAGQGVGGIEGTVGIVHCHKAPPAAPEAALFCADAAGGRLQNHAFVTKQAPSVNA